MKEEHHISRGLPSITSHTSVHQILLSYSALLAWMRQSESQPFNDIMEVCHVMSCDYHV